MKLCNKSIALILAAVMVLSWLLCVPLPVKAAAADYIAASYPASLSVKTTQAVNLMDVPSTDGTAKYTLPENTTLTVNKLHQNTTGGYFYQVLYYEQTLYIDATAVTMLDHLTGDITVADLMSPAALGYGQGFPIGGTVTAKLNKLGKIKAAVHYSSNLSAAPAISSTDTVNGYAYTMDSSTLDSNLIFSDLKAGSYTYLLTVEAISYYVEKGALTTHTQTVVLDNKPLIVTSASSPNKIIAKGIDVSYYQGNINWATVASQIDFAILRIGYEYTLDSQFRNYAAGCNANNIPFGVYIYSYAESEAEAIREAEFVISVLKDYEVDLPVFFDIEDSCQSALGSAAIQNIVKAFCETIKDAGYEPGLYTFLSWFNSYFSGSYYNSLPKWVAQIEVSNCSYAKGLTMWQYSWTGSFSGISGNVDCNYYYGEFPGKNTDTSALASCTYYPSSLDVTVTDTVNLRQYPGTAYTTQETLSAGTELRVTGLYQNTAGEYWYQVDRNGTTGYVSANYVSVREYRYDDLSVIDPAMTDLALNSGYYLKGKLRSQYHVMSKVNAKVYSGEDTLANPVLSSSASPNAKTYTLNYSEVCDNLIFSDLETGYYTYELSVDVSNYYVSGGSLASQTENIVVWTKPFTVGDAAVTPPEGVTCIHDIVTDTAVAAKCTTEGLSEGSHCSKCGVVFAKQSVIPATGHRYTTTSIPANCQDCEKTLYTCVACGDSYSVYTHELNSQWSEEKPAGIEEGLLETKEQYRYADFETFTQETPNLAGAELISSAWQSQGSKENHYVSSWPVGFQTTHSLYATYNREKITASETETSRVVIDSVELVGYVYYHWCRGTYANGPINRTTSTTQDTTHTTFHAFVANIATVDPTTLPTASDSSVTYANANCCTDSHWYYTIPVYAQKYTTYKAVFTYQQWSDWSQWSDTVATESDTRKVESRTVYRYTGKVLGDHIFENGTCILCGDTDECKHKSHDTAGICTGCGVSVAHTYEDGFCTVCGGAMPLPKITRISPSLSFEDEVVLNFYYAVSDLGSVTTEDMGLLLWTVPQAGGTVENAKTVIPGTVMVDGRYKVSTPGIPAKKMGDTVYFKIYFRLPDGSYHYSNLYHYSPRQYAESMLSGSNETIKPLVVSMLNYGAAAQQLFSYKAYDLVNSNVTAEQQALAEDYDKALLDDYVLAAAAKKGAFAVNTGFSKRNLSVDFGAAFSINFYLVPTYGVSGDVVMYIWDTAAYNGASVMNTSNAKASKVMTLTDGVYTASTIGIAAKDLDRTLYVAAMYTGTDGMVYTSGVMSYSVGAYCESQGTASTDMGALARATAVYSYHAKEYFYKLDN